MSTENSLHFYKMIKIAVFEFEADSGPRDLRNLAAFTKAGTIPPQNPKNPPEFLLLPYPKADHKRKSSNDHHNHYNDLARSRPYNYICIGPLE
ncbi:hypothetical protein Zmor_015872 [Zophobas morio]|uniref:Uncharacterized protein n=1 Tax=Zophobas morio TaxID=2755281 RepID=A0AA38MHW0_9CUCU|nr:hypothetical protein Zmor_015872 [Zophobas morio]